MRPTPDRVREAMFSILGDTVAGARVLDAWAGSGALGFEALSRGALHVTFIESDPVVIRVLRGNARALEVERRCGILAGEVAAWPRSRVSRARSVDLILADPPYGDDRCAALEQVVGTGWLRPGGRLVMESDARSGPSAPGRTGLVFDRASRYGRIRLDFYTLGDRPECP